MKWKGKDIAEEILRVRKEIIRKSINYLEKKLKSNKSKIYHLKLEME